jgi:hypothetical protein
MTNKVRTQVDPKKTKENFNLPENINKIIFFGWNLIKKYGIRKYIQSVNLQDTCTEMQLKSKLFHFNDWSDWIINL